MNQFSIRYRIIADSIFISRIINYLDIRRIHSPGHSGNHKPDLSPGSAKAYGISAVSAVCISGLS